MAFNIEQLREKYQQTYDNLGRDLAVEMNESRRRKKGVTSKNQQAMLNLVQIVGTKGKQDIKRINKTQSVKGAKEWIKKHGYVGYTADHEDVDGDNVKDVVVKDVDGNYVIINGYTVQHSDFPYRRKYYELDEDERKEYAGYKDYFRRGYYQPKYDMRTGKITGWGINPDEDSLTQDMLKRGYKTRIPRKMSPYQLFISTYVKNMYDFVIDFYQYRTADGKKPNIFIPLATKIWNDWVIDPILDIIFKGNAEKIKQIKEDPKEFNKLKSKSGFKDLMLDIVYNYFNHSDKSNEALLNNIHDIAQDLVMKWYDATGAEQNPNFGEPDNSVVLEEVVPQSPQRPNNEVNHEEEQGDFLN